MDNHRVSVENVARLPEPLTMDRVFACAQILASLKQTENVPLQAANEKGLGYDHMFGIGDHICPGAAVVAQRDGIVSLAGCGNSRRRRAPSL